MMNQPGNQKSMFWLSFLPPTMWLLIFLLVPLSAIGILSFSEKQGLIDIEISWVFDNYVRVAEPVYLSVFIKSIGIAGLTTIICFLVGFPIALGIFSAPKNWKPILLLIYLPMYRSLTIKLKMEVFLLKQCLKSDNKLYLF